MWRDTAGCDELAITRANARAVDPIANGACVGCTASCIQGLDQGEATSSTCKEGSVSDGPDTGYESRNDDAADVFADDIRATYAILDELLERLYEDCNTQTEWGEEIDRQNLRSLLQGIDEVEHVKAWVVEILDPYGSP